MGYIFSFYNYLCGDQNWQYLIIGLSYYFKENFCVSVVVLGVKGSVVEDGFFQCYELQVQFISLVFMLLCIMFKLCIMGLQIVVVVGLVGEEIWIDEYGCIKVQFYWDWLGSKDQNFSCWICVVINWVGSGFGVIFILCIGYEVVVDFFNGDLDYFIVMGCVYNVVNMLFWVLLVNVM